MTSRIKAGTRSPLEASLSLTVIFGDHPQDRIDIMNRMPVRMTGSVLEYRDRILRGLARVLMQAAAREPRVYRNIFPTAAVRLPPKSTRRGE